MTEKVCADGVGEGGPAPSMLPERCCRCRCVQIPRVYPRHVPTVQPWRDQRAWDKSFRIYLLYIRFMDNIIVIFDEKGSKCTRPNEITL